MLQVCCYDLPVLHSFAAVLVWTQAVIDWLKKPFWMHLFLRLYQWSLEDFSKRFSPKSPVGFTFFLPIAAPSLLRTAKGLWELPPSSAWMRALLAVMAKPLHLGKHTAEHHSTGHSIFKTSLSRGSKKTPLQPDFWETREDLCNAGLRDGSERGARYHQHEQRHLHYPTLRAVHPLQTTPESPAWTPWGQQQLLGSSWGCCSTSIFQHTKCSLRLPSRTLDFSMEHLGMCLGKSYCWK